MAPTQFPTAELQGIANAMQEFEAGASVANTGTGSRREGNQFEKLVGELWTEAATYLIAKGATPTNVTGPKGHRWTKLEYESRTLYLPSVDAIPMVSNLTEERWLGLTYMVSDLIAAFPGEAEAIERYGPDIGPFQGEDYPKMYGKRSTRFDDAIVLEDDGVLKEKILLEYKTAKSTSKRAIDGNAHERLSFQVLQYLEIATRYTCCTMAVLANAAFVKYLNKYHVSFHVQADRLANFKWFTMQHACTALEYAGFVNGLFDWLLTGRERETK